MITLRKMLPHDAPRTSQIHIKSWQKAYHNILPDHYLTSMDIKKRTFAWAQGMELNPDVIRLVVIQDNNIIGFACGLENRFPELLPEVTCELWMIYLDPEKWGAGCGSKLFLAFKKEMLKLGHKKMGVWVLKENNIAQKFYFKQGGQTAGVEKVASYGGKELVEIALFFNL